MTTTVFFRDDDVSGLSPALTAFVELFAEERLPCNYQVVPAQLEPRAVAFMRAKHKAQPDLVMLNQHGFRHEHVLNGKHTYEEFGGGRPFDEQLFAIAEGRRVMFEQFEGDFSGDVFTPPCHRYDANTLRALRALGFRVLSAGVRPSVLARAYYRVGRKLSRVSLLGKRVSYHGRRTPAHIADISCSVDVDPEINPGAKPKTFDDITSEFKRAARTHAIVGVMMHHETYTSTAKIELLRAFLRWLKGQQNLEFATIESVAARVS